MQRKSVINWWSPLRSIWHHGNTNTRNTIEPTKDCPTSTPIRATKRKRSIWRWMFDVIGRVSIWEYPAKDAWRYQHCARRIWILDCRECAKSSSIFQTCPFERLRYFEKRGNIQMDKNQIRPRKWQQTWWAEYEKIRLLRWHCTCIRRRVLSIERRYKMGYCLEDLWSSQ